MLWDTCGISQMPSDHVCICSQYSAEIVFISGFSVFGEKDSFSEGELWGLN